MEEKILRQKRTVSFFDAARAVGSSVFFLYFFRTEIAIKTFGK